MFLLDFNENYMYTNGQKEMITFEKHCTYHFIVSGSNWLWIDESVKCLKCINCSRTGFYLIPFVFTVSNKTMLKIMISLLNKCIEFDIKIKLRDISGWKKSSIKRQFVKHTVENTIWRSKSVQIRMMKKRRISYRST